MKTTYSTHQQEIWEAKETYLYITHCPTSKIDFDAPTGVREEIRNYLVERYGNDSVFGVVTFGTYKAKSALQDASRGLGKDTSFESILMREISKLKDLDEVNNLRDYFNKIKDLPTTSTNVKTWIEDNEDTIKWGDKLLGNIKNLGTHAGGILITPGPIYEYIPVTKGTNEIVTAFKEADGSSKDLSSLGLLKLDVLGLKTLNVIQESINTIKTELNIDITDKIIYPNLSDKKVLDTIKNNDTLGVFQLDLSASDLIKHIKPDSFEDIVAINALNRPGPKETFGFRYAEWKKNYLSNQTYKCKFDENYPKLDFMLEVTKNTYGCLIYQEQFMLMVKAAADFNMGEADNFRRAIAWKEDHPKYHTVAKYFEKLKEGMIKKGYSENDVKYFLEYCRKFMGYSFNLAHSVSYSYISFQCLYLKTYYPLHFYCAYLNYEPWENYQVVISELFSKDIKILPPSITKSKYNFSVEGDAIRVGLKAIKGFGESAYNELIKHDLKEIKTLNDFFKRKIKINSGVLIKAIEAGAFNEFDDNVEKLKIVVELYKDTKIEKWFTRKRNPLQIENMPEILKQFDEDIIWDCLKEIQEEVNPWEQFEETESFFAFDKEDDKTVEQEKVKKNDYNLEKWEIFIEKLIDKVEIKSKSKKSTIEMQNEHLGFSLETAKYLKKLDELIDKNSKYNLKTLSERESNETICAWLLVEKKKALTKKGKPYWQLKIGDKKQTINAKCWEFLEFEKNEFYMSKVTEDNYGFTVVSDRFLLKLT